MANDQFKKYKEMKLIKSITPILALSLLLLSSFTIDKRTEKKLLKDIKSVWELKDAAFIKIKIEGIQNGDDLYLVKSADKTVGFAYLGLAESRSEKIDYSILFNLDATISKVNIIKYRENYGGEVGSKRWLKQFIGKLNGEEMKYRNDISAISGATISVKSMVNAIEGASKFVFTNKEKIYE